MRHHWKHVDLLMNSFLPFNELQITTLSKCQRFRVCPLSSSLYCLIMALASMCWLDTKETWATDIYTVSGAESGLEMQDHVFYNIWRAILVHVRSACEVYLLPLYILSD